MRLITIGLACLAVLLVPGAAQAKVHFLDTYDRASDPYAGPLKTERLVRGVPYRAAVRGTFSLFSAVELRNPFCGTSESKPMFPSKRRTNGPVVGDAEFLFADLSRNCKKRTKVQTATTFQIKVLSKYSNPTPIGGVGTAPKRSHSYVYALQGKGKVARFRLYDQFTKDNYGRLRITISRARAANCANNGFANWKFVDEATCVKATQRKIKTPVKR